MEKNPYVIQTLVDRITNELFALDGFRLFRSMLNTVVAVVFGVIG